MSAAHEQFLTKTAQPAVVVATGAFDNVVQAPAGTVRKRYS